jgi:hypothetical protein
MADNIVNVYGSQQLRLTVPPLVPEVVLVTQDQSTGYINDEIIFGKEHYELLSSATLAIVDILLRSDYVGKKIKELRESGPTVMKKLFKEFLKVMKIDPADLVEDIDNIREELSALFEKEYSKKVSPETRGIVAIFLATLEAKSLETFFDN